MSFPPPVSQNRSSTPHSSYKRKRPEEKSLSKTAKKAKVVTPRRSARLEEKRKASHDEEITPVKRKSIPAATDPHISVFPSTKRLKKTQTPSNSTSLELNPSPSKAAIPPSITEKEEEVYELVNPNDNTDLAPDVSSPTSNQETMKYQGPYLTILQSGQLVEENESLMAVDETSSEGEESHEIDTSSLLIIADNFKSPLSQTIVQAYNCLIKLFPKVNNRTLKNLKGITGKISLSDLIAFQIGWGKRVIEWYKASKKNLYFIMPGDGFRRWDPLDLAQKFYTHYAFDSGQNQFNELHCTIKEILGIVEEAYKDNQLDRKEIFPYCPVVDKKKWSLNEWIQDLIVIKLTGAANAIQKKYIN